MPPSSPAWTDSLQSVTSFALKLLPASLSTALSLAYPLPLKETENLAAGLLANTPVSRQAHTADTGAAADQGQDIPAIPACPFTWSKPIHELNCDVIWPKQYTGDHGSPLIELDTPEYLGKIAGDKTVEKLLAMGGLRLASILNTVLGAEDEQGLYFAY